MREEKKKIAFLFTKRTHFQNRTALKREEGFLDWWDMNKKEEKKRFFIKKRWNTWEKYDPFLWKKKHKEVKTKESKKKRNKRHTMKKKEEFFLKKTKFTKKKKNM